MTRPLLLALFVLVCVFAYIPRARAIFIIETTEGKVWVWQESEMDALKRDVGRLILERDEWKHKAETPKECV